MGDAFEEIMKKHNKLEKDLARTRNLSRDAIYKIVLISAMIVGFSVTLASLESLNKNIDLQLLYKSWELFLGVIVLGFFILFLEPRMEHAKIWRHFLLYENVTDEEIEKITQKQKIKIYCVLLKSLLKPENLCLGKKSTKEKEHEDQVLSYVLLNKMAQFQSKILFWAENIFVILFLFSLVVFIRSFAVF